MATGRKTAAPATTVPTAERFIEQLLSHQSDAELEKIQRYFKTGTGEYGAGDVFVGVRMGQVFALAKEFIDLAPDEIERLLESEIHEVRAGALSIMGKQAARKKTTADRRAELYELYLRRTDRIDNWDLVDLSCHLVIGAYLYDFGLPRDVLDELARSDNLWERRIAILSTLASVRKGELDDTYRLAELLIDDDHDLIHKPVGGMLRETGKHDRPRLLAFLDRHAATMPRIMLRYAIEHLDKDVRRHYLDLHKR